MKLYNEILVFQHLASLSIIYLGLRFRILLKSKIELFFSVVICCLSYINILQSRHLNVSIYIIDLVKSEI